MRMGFRFLRIVCIWEVSYEILDRDSKKYSFGRTVFMPQPDCDSKRIHLVGLATSKNPTKSLEI